MTVFVTQPAKRGNRMFKPLVVAYPYDSGDSMHWLISRHPDAIYYTDDTSEWDAAPVTETHIEYQIVAHGGLAVSPVVTDAITAQHILSTRDFAPGEAEVRSRIVTTITTQWKIEESK